MDDLKAKGAGEGLRDDLKAKGEERAADDLKAKGAGERPMDDGRPLALLARTRDDLKAKSEERAADDLKAKGGERTVDKPKCEKTRTKSGETTVEERKCERTRGELTAKGIDLLLHGAEHCKDMFIAFVKFLKCLLIDITTRSRKFEPGLGFGCFLSCVRQFVEKNGLVFSFSPSFGQVRADGARRPADLIGQ
jgi:hypothetical protein